MAIKASIIPVVIALLIFVTYVPPVLSESSVNVSIVVVSGDYSKGVVPIMNPTGEAYGRTYLRAVWVESQNGSQVEGINVTLTPLILGGWNKDEVVTFSYYITCSERVPAGNYSLKLRFLATLPSGSLRTFVVSIPLEVLSVPVSVGQLSIQPEDGTVFIGDSLVVYSPISNLGHKNVSVNVRLSVRGVGELYSISKSMVIAPGDSSLVFEIPIDSKYSEGEYTVELTVRCSNTSISRLRKFKVLMGVSVVSVSLEKDRLYLNDTGSLYITLMSVRNANLTLVASYYNENRFVKNTTIPVTVTEGTQVVKVPLLTEIPGNYTLKYRVSLLGVGISGGEVHYTVLSPPSITNISVVGGEKGVVFNIQTYNPDSKKSGVLLYNVTIDGAVSYSGSTLVEIPPGEGLVVLTIPLAAAGDVAYNFTLKVGEYISSYSGLWVYPAPEETSTPTVVTSSETSTSTTPTSESNSSVGEIYSARGRAFWGVILLVIVLITTLAWVVWQREFGAKNKRRVRPRPKRRSPLGRFKRPKPPKFRSFKSLPKKR
ncbi:COG1361 family protein [Thermococcus peptonophilus]|uniref:Uncharacterized protein n=1 Tax=Thermococcus peptonophilus TaxID=53952 RepID=A0A142CVI9_9EURY|nr:hypothetical protein [Thermococcus peptonophilus]AMQ18791.1 hypothetical protein A0127_06195 [Thermococcus peptonophilus]